MASPSPPPPGLDPNTPPPPRPAAINYVLGFLMVGLAWGLTTPFIRRAAKDHQPPPHPILSSDAVQRSPVRRRVYGALFAVLDLLRNPRYAVPLVLNLTGSVWFFLLIGKAGMYLSHSHYILPVSCARRFVPWCDMCVWSVVRYHGNINLAVY